MQADYERPPLRDERLSHLGLFINVITCQRRGYCIWVRLLPLQLNVEGGYVFTCLFVCYLSKKIFLPSMFVCSVYVFFCHTILASFQAIVLNFFVYVGDWSKTATHNFGEDPNPDMIIF